jgi:hypothetical protein
MLVRVRDTGAVMYLPQWEQTFPETSFPNPVPTETINEFGADVVLDGPYPTYGTYQYVIDGPVVLQDGQWYTSFIVKDMDADQIAAKNAELAADNKAKGKQILSDTDWTAIASVADPAESNPYLTNRQAFLEYRSAVRAIVLNPQFDSVFPTEPAEVWSTT